MKKLITIFSIIIMICACAFAVSVTGFAQTQTDSEDKLFLPGSYEQYLELIEPTDFAISDKYIAIADKKDAEKTVLYLFDRAEEKYKSYDVTTRNTVSSLNFYSTDGADYLFFLETGNIVNYIPCSTFDEHETLSDFTASAMHVSGNDIYYAIQTSANSSVRYTTITNLSIDTENYTEISNGSIATNNYPSFSEYNGNVYFSADNHIYLCTKTAMSEKFSTNEAINHFALFGDSNNDLIYTTNIVNNIVIGTTNPTTIQNMKATVVKYFDGYAYFLVSKGVSQQDKGVLQYDIENAKFTDYEIGKYSNSLNRLNAPSDISAYGDKIVIADKGNNRVTVYDGNSYTAITPQITPSAVCAGENNFLVINGAIIHVYDYSGVCQKILAPINSDVLSVTFSIDTFFIASTNGSTYSLNSETLEISDAYSPQIANVESIAADLYGNIYVLNSSGQVNSYTVSAFLSNEASTGTSVTQLNSSCTKLLVDYDANIYGLSETVIYSYKDGQSSQNDISLKDFVFGGESKVAVSFALSLNDSGVYILSDGFIVRKELGISTLENISANGLYEKIYQTAPTSQNLIVSVPQNSIAVNIDITALEENTEVLPYLSYERLTEDEIGVVLGVIDTGYVVAFYEYTPSATSAQLPKREYTVRLISANNAVLPTPDESYFTEDIKTGYLSSDVNLYRRPLMQDFAKIEIIERNEAVYVSGKVSLSKNTLDDDYYFVETANGNYGFIPSSFVTENAPVELENEQFSYQTLKNGKSATLTSQTGASITLDNKEQLRVYDLPASQSGYKVVSYEKDGVTYYGEVEAKSLNEASPSVIVTLVIVSLVAASVILSTCYLLFRKKPTLD